MTITAVRVAAPTELEDLQEHYERYRAITLEHLDMLSEEQLAWRPRPDAFNCGQILLHIVQSENFYAHGLFSNDWDYDRMRFPKPLPEKTAIAAQFAQVRALLFSHFAALAPEQLNAVVRPPRSPVEYTLRSWLWFVLEHEIHHKAQLSEYMRQMGLVPPFAVYSLARGQRPDIKFRTDMGGV